MRMWHFNRASLSETVAWSLPPLVLWGLYRWQQDKSGWGLVTAVFSFILLVLTHDVTAYAFLPLFVGWIGMWGLKDASSWPTLRRGALGLLLGIGGSAFFWLPAIFERSAIQFDRASSAWPFLYVNNFLPLEQLLALPRNADPSLLNDWPPRGLGILLLIVALAGAALAWRRAKSNRWVVGFLLLGLAGYLFLTVSLSEPLWTAVPQLAAFQFPWRFLAPASFLAAFLCGGARLPDQPPAGSVENDSPGGKPTGVALSSLAIVVLSVGHWGWLYPDHCATPDDLSVSGMVGWEVATQTIGSTASGELLPRGVKIVPDPTNPPAWQARLDPTTLPQEAELLTTNHQPLATTIELETAVPFQATLRIFNFPGWRVTINGEPAPITPSNPEGLITVPVPNGRSTIQATFGETPLRLAADGVSLISLLLLLGIIRQKRLNIEEIRDCRREINQSPTSGLQSSTTEYWLLFTLGLLLLSGKFLLVDAGQTLLRQPRLQDGVLANVAQPLNVTLGTPDNPAQVRLLGLAEWETAVPANAPLTLTLYWQALQPLMANYKVGLTLLDANGIRWSDDGLRDYRWLRNPPPTAAWPTDQYTLTSFFVDMLPSTPPGEYQIAALLF